MRFDDGFYVCLGLIGAATILGRCLDRPPLRRKTVPETTETPAVWAIVELMGHVKMAGRLSEEERFGSKMGRLDVPTPGEPMEFATQYFGGGSVYRITHVTEDVARHVAKGNKPQPVSPWDFPKQLTAAPVTGTSDGGSAYRLGWRDHEDDSESA